MPDAHLAAVKSARIVTRDLRDLFDRIAAERGAIEAAYRTAKRAIRGQVENAYVMHDALTTLRYAVSDAISGVLADAYVLGSQHAEQQGAIYGLPVYGLPAQTNEALRAILADLDAQLAAVTASALTIGDEALILGDPHRAGLLTSGPVETVSQNWIATLAVAALTDSLALAIDRAGAQDEFMRQAIAAIDDRTTDCCLRVHGQTVKMNGKFHLTGTPRFADYIKRPPFHWRCRTAEALVRAKDAGDELTIQMRDAARAEIHAREVTGAREVIRPSHARSRRG